MCSPRRTVPAAGSASPASTRASVVLPAPFRPTRPTLSPGPIWKLAPSSSSCAPARSSRPDAAITRTTPTARTGEAATPRATIKPTWSPQRYLPSTASSSRASRAGRAAGSVSWTRTARNSRGRVLEHHQPGIGHGEEPVGGQVEVRPQPRVLAQPGHRAPVPAQHHRVQLARVPAEHPDRGVRRRGQRLDWPASPGAGRTGAGTGRRPRCARAPGASPPWSRPAGAARR